MLHTNSLQTRKLRQRNFPGLVQKLDNLFFAIP